MAADAILDYEFPYGGSTWAPPQMSYSHKNKTFSVLQAILKVKKLIFQDFTDNADVDFTAAILVNRAVIAEIPPRGFFSLRVSLNQNKCQISSILESPQEYMPDAGL